MSIIVMVRVADPVGGHLDPNPDPTQPSGNNWIRIRPNKNRPKNMENMELLRAKC